MVTVQWLLKGVCSPASAVALSLTSCTHSKPSSSVRWAPTASLRQGSLKGCPPVPGPHSYYCYSHLILRCHFLCYLHRDSSLVHIQGQTSLSCAPTVSPLPFLAGVIMRDHVFNSVFVFQIYQYFLLLHLGFELS